MDFRSAITFKRPLKKWCRILPAGGLGGSLSFKKSPKIGGYRGLIEANSVVSLNMKRVETRRGDIYFGLI
jgi:hypothetical protein